MGQHLVKRKRAGMRRRINLILSAAPGATGFVRAGAAGLFVMGLAGCQPTVTPTPVPNAVTGQNPGDVKYYPSDEPVKTGDPAILRRQLWSRPAVFPERRRDDPQRCDGLGRTGGELRSIRAIRSCGS